jgi:hypothetical protein
MCQQRLLLICDFGEALVQHRSDAGVKVALRTRVSRAAS